MNSTNSCSPKFDGEVSFSCVLELFAEARNGFSQKLALKAMWIAGCAWAQLGGNDEVTTTNVEPALEFTSLDEAVNYFEAQVDLRQSSIQTEGGPVMSDQTWWIPIVISIIELIIKNRQGK